ncbi:hypothetical protein [Maribacter sp. LLG6340-A2]|uniref:hypothetical protein n=1 Tax=Maribacter sp. LLG6340-A2 TaxID=3160834 RepID=UPI003864FDBD
MDNNPSYVLEVYHTKTLQLIAAKKGLSYSEPIATTIGAFSIQWKIHPKATDILRGVVFGRD